MVLLDTFNIENEHCTREGDVLYTNYVDETTTIVHNDDGSTTIKPKHTKYTFRTNLAAPKKMGIMLVGLGGNNGTTVTAGLMVNRLKTTWRTKEGTLSPDFYGSVTQSSTVRLGENDAGEPVFCPLGKIVPLADTSNVVVGGWDISGMPLGDAMRRAQVLDIDLQDKLYDEMQKIVPLPSVYDQDFIATNQIDRADNLIEGDRQKQVDTIRKNIRDFKEEQGVDQVVVLWTATTECFADVKDGLNKTADELLASIKADKRGISPSSMFAVASILEGVPFINGSPQNTLLPGVVDLAVRHNVPLGGDDFKSGQTKMKSCLMEFLTDAGLKPRSIVSYNHLGNNDGRNLSEPKQFRSKEISKSDVILDMVRGNEVIYPQDSDDSKVDHCVVIKYIPYVQDSKRALDEYTSEIFLKGKNTIVMHNTCEDSLLAAPLIIDLCLLAELALRVHIKVEDGEYQPLHPVTPHLGYLTKAPLPPQGNRNHIVNALSRQRQGLENFLRVLVGLPTEDNLRLEWKL